MAEEADPALVAERALDLWFFRDLSDEQRRRLIRLAYGDGVAREADTLGYQRIVLGKLKRDLSRLAAEHRAQSEGITVANDCTFSEMTENRQERGSLERVGVASEGAQGEAADVLGETVERLQRISINARQLECAKEHERSGLWKLCADEAEAALTALRARSTTACADMVRQETWESINQWCDDTFGLATIPQIIGRAKEEFDELEKPDADHAIEAADVVICLCRIPGFADALQRKMAINRKRKWRLVGNGTGYHIPDAAAPSQISAGEN